MTGGMLDRGDRDGDPHSKYKGRAGISLEPPHAVTPLPWRDLVFISIIQAGQALQITMLIPIFVFMVHSYGVARPEDQSVGGYAGVMAALFPLGQFCTSLLWGSISDRTGRKMWLAWGNGVTAVSALLLGVVRNYYVACCVQLLNGLLNCTQFLTASTLAGYCDKTNQSRGFAVLNTAWGVGSIMGSLLGGLLAEPCKAYALATCPPLYEARPFILPFLFTAIYALFALACSLLLTDPTRRHGATLGRGSDVADSELVQRPFLVQEEGEEEEDVEGGQHRGAGVRGRLLLGPAADGGLVGGGVLDEPAQNGDPERGEGDAWRMAVALPLRHRVVVTQKPAKEGGPPSAWQLLQDKGIMHVCSTFGFMTFVFIFGEELFPMFAAAPQPMGGLGLKARDLGLQLGLAGTVIILYTLFLYPPLARHYGAVRCVQCAILAAGPLYLATPFCSLLLAQPLLEWALLLATVFGRAVVVGTGFVSAIVLLTNSAPPKSMGAVVGIGHSFSSLFRAGAPALGGVLWSLSLHLKFPLHQFLAWVLVAVMSALTYSYASCLPLSLNAPRTPRSAEAWSTLPGH